MRRRTLKILASNVQTKFERVELFLVGIALLLCQLERVRLLFSKRQALG